MRVSRYCAMRNSAMRNSAHLAAVLWLTACGCGSVVAPDAAAPDADMVDAHALDSSPDGAVTSATLPGCEGINGLELGRCELEDGSDCGGAADEGGHFVSVAPGTELPVIRGPQGFEMLILAARASGIDPGDPSMPSSSMNPRVEIHLIDPAGTEQSLYRGRSAFLPEAASADTFFNAGLFVIVAPTTTGLRGGDSRALGKLTDAAGVTRCGELTLRVGLP